MTPSSSGCAGGPRAGRPVALPAAAGPTPTVDARVARPERQPFALPARIRADDAGSLMGFASTSTSPSAGRTKRTRRTRRSARSGVATATQRWAEASGQRPCRSATESDRSIGPLPRRRHPARGRRARRWRRRPLRAGPAGSGAARSAPARGGGDQRQRHCRRASPPYETMQSGTGAQQPGEELAHRDAAPGRLLVSGLAGVLARGVGRRMASIGSFPAPCRTVALRGRFPAGAMTATMGNDAEPALRKGVPGANAPRRPARSRRPVALDTRAGGRRGQAAARNEVALAAFLSRPRFVVAGDLRGRRLPRRPRQLPASAERADHPWLPRRSREVGAQELLG